LGLLCHFLFPTFSTSLSVLFLYSFPMEPSPSR
jgi:hypothetical protein